MTVNEWSEVRLVVDYFSLGIMRYQTIMSILLVACHFTNYCLAQTLTPTLPMNYFLIPAAKTFLVLWSHGIDAQPQMGSRPMSCIDGITPLPSTRYH